LTNIQVVPTLKSNLSDNIIYTSTFQLIWNDLKKEISLPNIQNPLPNTLHIKLDNTKYINDVMGKLTTVKGIDDTSYHKDLVKSFELINNISRTVTFFVVIISSILTLVVINNTIELVIQSKKDEIEIMRLMGVNNWYIKTPLVLQGAIYGFVGAVLAIVPVNFLNGYLIKMHNFFMFPVSVYSQFITILAVLMLGLFFAAGGSLMSIKKHLEV
jgi:cell division transport system permease protein